MLKYTAKCHVDYKPILEVCKTVEDIIGMINRKKKFFDAHERVVGVEKRVIGIEVCILDIRL